MARTKDHLWLIESTNHEDNTCAVFSFSLFLPFHLSFFFFFFIFCFFLKFVNQPIWSYWIAGAQKKIWKSSIGVTQTRDLSLVICWNLPTKLVSWTDRFTARNIMLQTSFEHSRILCTEDFVILCTEHSGKTINICVEQFSNMHWTFVLCDKHFWKQIWIYASIFFENTQWTFL